MAGHVAAHPHVHLGWRAQLQRRIEAGHAVHVVHVQAAPLGHLFQLFPRQVAVPPLDLLQLLENALGGVLGTFAIDWEKTRTRHARSWIDRMLSVVPLYGGARFRDYMTNRA